jgi:hypothetical protein
MPRNLFNCGTVQVLQQRWWQELPNTFVSIFFRS